MKRCDKVSALLVASPLAARGEDGGEGFWNSVATKAANPHPTLSL